MDHLRLIELVQSMIDNKNSAEEIVDTIIHELIPEDGCECPVCGVCP